MSLDVYLRLDSPFKRGPSSGIFIREDGQKIEISREEWDRRNPGREPVAVLRDPEEEIDCVYSSNITHNLSKMADEAGLYDPLWRPKEVGFTKAKDLIKPVERGLADLKKRPKHFKQYNPENGWGSYDLLVKFTEEYLAACKEFPEATVEADR